MTRFKPSPCYSEAQLAQLQGARVRLGDLHRAAERELQDVLNSYPTIRQYAAAGGSLATLATRIKSLVQRRAQIRLVALSENLITPTLVFGTRCVCDDSDENPYTEISRSQNHDAEHIIAIDALLELAQQGKSVWPRAARNRRPPQNSLLAWLD